VNSDPVTSKNRGLRRKKVCIDPASLHNNIIKPLLEASSGSGEIKTCYRPQACLGINSSCLAIYSSRTVYTFLAKNTRERLSVCGNEQGREYT